MKKHSSRLIILLLVFPFTAICQKKLYLTLRGGTANYYGDLQEKRFTLQQAHKAFGVGLALQVKPNFYLHGTLTKGKISADDKLSSSPQKRARNLSFYSNVWEAALTGEYALKDLSYSTWTPYGFAGLALFRFNPHASIIGELPRYGTEGQGIVAGRKPYRIITISAPIGLGVRIRIAQNTHLGYEIGFRPTLTDYLDDVSKTYVDQNLLLQKRGQTAVDVAFRGNLVDKNALYPAAGTPRGNPANKDMYYFSTIRLSIGLTNDDGRLFGKTVRRGSTICPKW